MSATAIFSRNRIYHSVFAVVFLVAMVLWESYSLEGILDLVGGDS